MRPPARQKTDADVHGGNIGQRMDEYWFRLAGFLSRPGSLLVAVLLVFLATRLWLLTGFEATWPDSQTVYADYARQGVDHELAAYRDFRIEYPPLAWWLMAVPRLIDSRRMRTRGAAGSGPAIPRLVWPLVSSRIVSGRCGLPGADVSRRAKNAARVPWALAAFYTLLTVAQPHLIYDRLDIVLLLFFLLSIACWLRSLADSPAANRWATASYLFLGLGISLKIMPLIFVPFLLLADLWAAGGARRFAGRFMPRYRHGGAVFGLHPIGGLGRFLAVSVSFRTGHSHGIDLGEHAPCGRPVRGVVPGGFYARRLQPKQRMERRA